MIMIFPALFWGGAVKLHSGKILKITCHNLADKKNKPDVIYLARYLPCVLVNIFSVMLMGCFLLTGKIHSSVCYTLTALSSS